VKSQSAARSYAKALHDLARERGQAEAVGTELAQAVDVVRTDPALAHFFARPGVAAIAKRRTDAATSCPRSVRPTARAWTPTSIAPARVCAPRCR